MKTIVYALLFFFPFVIFGQTAPLKVTVTDSKQKPYVGDQIIFIGQKSGKELIGKTGADGSFKINLPAGDIYTIKVKSFTAEKDYSTVEVPTLPEGQEFQEMQLQIMYEMSNSITLDDLHFETGKSSIKANSYEMLNQLADYLKNRSDLKIEIAGHTDNVGNEDANMILSQKRAEAVKNYLIKKGVPASRLTSKGYGESRPLETNETAQGRQQNRRTEIYIL